MTGDLIERLRASDTLSRGENYEPYVIPASELRLEAADTIAALRETANSWRRVAERLEGEKLAAESSLAEARRLLKPFADAKGHFDGHVRDDDTVEIALRNIRAHHVRAAARFLSQEAER